MNEYSFDFFILYDNFDENRITYVVDEKYDIRGENIMTWCMSVVPSFIRIESNEVDS